MKDTMKKIGYMVVKFGKRSITICLFNESESDLKDMCVLCGFKGTEVVPCYEDADGKRYVGRGEEIIARD